MRCTYNGRVCSKWDWNNLRKIRAHRITREEAEQALLNDPVLMYEQTVEEELRFVYYGETSAGRMLAVIIAEGSDNVRVVTAYNLAANQKRDYLLRRMKGQ